MRAAVCAAVMYAAPAWAQESPFQPRTYDRGELKVTVGAARMIMRGPMFPGAMLFDDGSIMVLGSAEKEGGPVTYVRSTDRGETWKPFKAPSEDYCMPNLQFADGTSINSSSMPKPIDDKPGYYKTVRFESKDRGLTGTAVEGSLYLPPEVCSPKNPLHFHGNTIKTKRGELLSVLQSLENEGAPEWPEAYKTPFKCFMAKSEDDGRTWKYLSHVASIRDITGPAGDPLRKGWKLWGACEPALMEVAPGKLVCVMRTLNDGAKPLIGEPTDTYRDLFHTLRGNDIYPGSLKLPADKFYSLSNEPMPPMIICYSEDHGETWTKPVPMKEARGNMPHMCFDGKILALSAGGLHYPRWGNAIQFSLDAGKTWTEPINFAPFFTTGYGGLVMVEPERYLAFFDYAAPQPWKDHTAHWVGVVEIKVERK